jgi:hypothetical protein
MTTKKIKIKKPWSVSTTVRNPERMRDFLKVLTEFDGLEWNTKMQMNFQISLIQNRLYGYGESQFYKNLTKEQIEKIEDLTYNLSFFEAEEIFHKKNYEDPSIRGRQSLNPLKKFGFASVQDKKLHITELGKLFLKEDYDIGEIFFISFLKWQIPNPESKDYNDNFYNIKPFIGTLHLINLVNCKEQKAGYKVKGISKEEFDLFVPTLINYNDIENYATIIINIRRKQEKLTKKEQKEVFEIEKSKFLSNFLASNKLEEVNKLFKNLKDYGDNALRYFRLTRFFHIRGEGFYIDLEHRRSLEVKSLLEFDNGKAISFKSGDEYISYISDITKPTLPWETKEKLKAIIKEILLDIRECEKSLKKEEKIIEDYINLSEIKLKNLIEELRIYRRNLQELKNHHKSSEVSQILEYIKILENIKEQEDKPIALEKYTTLGLHSLNDAIQIKPNYPVGDDNEPTFTAPAGKPDIEMYYESFNAICEVTMLTGRNQWYNEGQPVMRHLRDFEIQNKSKESYCLFIAPALHRDTLNTFWFAVKYEYEGKKQNIIPLSIIDFTKLLQILINLKEKGKSLEHLELLSLYKKIIDNSNDCKDAMTWKAEISKVIDNWGREIIAF